MQDLPLSELEKLYQNQYVSHTDLADFTTNYHLKSPTKSEVIKQLFKLAATFQFQKLRTYRSTTAKLYHYLNHRDRLNREFIKREQANPYQIEGGSLDPQQIAAAVVAEDATLILAPAGSGKTASLLAKLNYLTERLQIPPQDILVIAFTNKVVTELKDRVARPGVEIRTFHSLGNKIIKQHLKHHKLITEEQTRHFFHQAIQNLCHRDHDYANLYDSYLHANDVSDAVAQFLNLITSTRTGPHTDTKALEQLFISIQSLQKSERVSLSELKRRLENIPNSAARAQSLDFYHLYAPVVEQYTKYLERSHLYDFADMLNLATDLVRQMPKNTFNYQYVLVDEAQDLSTSKYLLLKTILEKCTKAKLFAVGDDWQSIYRFAGSNLHVLDNFEQIFGRTTYRGLIELTYRFGQPTAKISNQFIQKNPHQSRKRVIPHVKRRTPIIIKLNLHKQPRRTPQDYKIVDSILQNLYTEYGEKIFAKKVQVIARYNRDIFRLVREETREHQHVKLTNLSEFGAELEWSLPGTAHKLKIPFCSMHKAKGITRDIIIVINANSGDHGIPATRSNHPVAEVLLTKLDDYPHAEERRLFYVAITRAKEKTYIVSDAIRISPFVFEISPKLKGAGVKVCPKCHRGILQERRRRDGKIYYSCSNYAGGCHYTTQ